MKRGIVVEFTQSAYEALRAGRISFEGPFTIGAEIQLAAKDAVVVRIEADWLPDWAETPEGAYFPNAVCKVSPTGVVESIREGEARLCTVSG